MSDLETYIVGIVIGTLFARQMIALAQYRKRCRLRKLIGRRTYP